MLTQAGSALQFGRKWRADPSYSANPMRPIVRDALGIGVATGAYGLSFGALAVAAGLSLPQACALSLLMFTGASQFAFVGLIGGGAAAAVATALLLGARNALYGLRLAPYLRPRPLAAHLVIDESAAMAVRDTPADTRLGFWSTGAAVFVFWNLATLLGALAGQALSDPRALGLDAAAPGGLPRPAGAATARARTADDRGARRGGGADLGAAGAGGNAGAGGRGGGDGGGAGAARRGRGGRWRGARVARRRAAARRSAAASAARRGRVARRRAARAAPGLRGAGRSPVWTPILIAAGGCYVLKLAGLSVPQRVLDGARVQRVAVLLPVALLAALISTQTFGEGLDARAAGLAAAVVALAAAGAVSRRRHRGRRHDRDPSACHVMRFAVGLPNLHDYAEPGRLVELAQAAETAGWDGCFIWDHLAYRDPPAPAADPQVVLGAIAVSTSRIRIGALLTPLARRRPSKVARETATLDVLSGGRLVFGAALGWSGEEEFEDLGEPGDDRIRADKLDEGLAVLDALWSGEPVDFARRALHGPRHALHAAPAAAPADPGLDRRRLAEPAPVPPRRALGRRLPDPERDGRHRHDAPGPAARDRRLHVRASPAGPPSRST